MNVEVFFFFCWNFKSSLGRLKLQKAENARAESVSSKPLLPDENNGFTQELNTTLPGESPPLHLTSKVLFCSLFYFITSHTWPHRKRPVIGQSLPSLGRFSKAEKKCRRWSSLSYTMNYYMTWTLLSHETKNNSPTSTLKANKDFWVVTCKCKLVLNVTTQKLWFKDDYEILQTRKN